MAHLVSLKRLFDDLKDDKERQEVLEALRERVKKGKRDTKKWDWAKYPVIVRVIDTEDDGVVIEAKKSLEGKRSSSRFFLLAWNNFDRVDEDTWPLLYEYVKESKCEKMLKGTRFYKTMKK